MINHNQVGKKGVVSTGINTLRDEILELLQESDELAVNQLFLKLHRRKNSVISELHMMEQEGIILVEKIGRAKLIKYVPIDIQKFIKISYWIIERHTKMAFSLIERLKTFEPIFVRNSARSKTPVFKDGTIHRLLGIVDCINSIVRRIGILIWLQASDKLVAKHQDIIEKHNRVCIGWIKKIIWELLKKYTGRKKKFLKNFLNRYLAGF